MESSSAELFIPMWVSPTLGVREEFWSWSRVWAEPASDWSEFESSVGPVRKAWYSATRSLTL